MQDIIEALKTHIEIVDRGQIKQYLGMEIERVGAVGEITFHQKNNVDELLRRWNMQDCKGAITPFNSGEKFTECQEVSCHGFKMPEYQSMVGALTYLAVTSIPDIAHTISKLAQFQSHPHEQQFIAAKRVLRYLKSKPKATIRYLHSNVGIVCYTDADWGSEITERRSYSGYALYINGNLISLESKNQTVVALSTMEAEYISMCAGVKEVVFFRNLLEELGFSQHIREAAKLLCDNQSAQFAVKNPVTNKRSKHIDIRYHYIREKFLENTIEVIYVPSEDIVADILTKNLFKLKHEKLCSLLKVNF